MKTSKQKFIRLVSANMDKKVDEIAREAFIYENGFEVDYNKIESYQERLVYLSFSANKYSWYDLNKKAKAIFNAAIKELCESIR